MSRLRLAERRPAFVGLVSGVLLGLSFPEADLWPLAWIAIAPLLVAAYRAPLKDAFRVGFVFGIGFFGSLLTWISIVGWVAWIVLVLMESLYIGVFAVGWAWLSRSDRAVVRAGGAAALWALMEIARTNVPVVGFAWGELAQSQHDIAWILQPASWGGRYLVSLVIVAFNCCIAERYIHRERRFKKLVAAFGILAVTFMVPATTGEETPVRVAIVQGNVPRDFEGTAAEKDLSITGSHAALSADAAESDPDMVVWPESSVGLDPERIDEVGDLLAEGAQAAGAPLVVGANTDRDDGKYQVMAFLVSPEGEIVDRYQKVHLVPFGEYIPNRSLFGAIPMLDQVPRDAVPGKSGVLFEVAGGKVAPVISFEGDFGSLVRERIGSGGQLLIVATNTSTWGESWASAQHVAMSQVRAAENRVWTVHAALSGISAFIAPDGTVVSSLPLWTAATRTEEIAFVSKGSVYSRVGDLPVFLLILGLLARAIGSARARRDPG